MLAPIPLSNYLSKLERRLPLRDSDRAAVLALPAAVKRVAPGEVILDDCHDAAGSLVILSRGFAVASRMMPQERRHIAAFVLPSDALNLAAIVTGRQTVRVQAQGEAELVVIERADVTALMESRAEVARALWLDTLGDAAIAEAWAANVGQRRGRSRLAHLLLELRHRFAAIGALENGGFRLAGNQAMLADALGLSLVHLNKSLSALRLDGDVTVSNHIYRILDPDRLAAAVGFDPAYLR